MSIHFMPPVVLYTAPITIGSTAAGRVGGDMSGSTEVGAGESVPVPQEEATSPTASSVPIPGPPLASSGEHLHHHQP